MPKEGGDAYAQLLRRQYEFFKTKYQLREMEATNWKFSRMRPSGFPTRKIALLAALLHKHANLMQQFLDKTLLPPHWQGVLPSAYWAHNYNFGKSTTKNLGGLSADFVRNLQINVQFPFLLYWANENNDDTLKAHIIDSLEKLPAENNRITRQYVELGFPNNTAFYSQGILELAQQKCAQKKCLQCSIGTQLLKQK